MSRRSGLRTWALLGALTVGLVLALESASVRASRASTPASGVFASDSPFNAVIPANPAVDAKSADMVRYATAGGVHANLVEFGVPIVEPGAGTTRFAVTCDGPTSWGRCPLAGLSIPIPSSAKPQAGSDGAMVVVDRAADRAYEFWRARRVSGGWTTAWGSVSSLSGQGWSSMATGSGASRLGGVIRVAEVQSGVIPHALVLQSSNTCATQLRAPATKTDGTSTRPDCLPEGARLQLDPTLDVSSIRGMTRTERAIATALQTYGAYVIDSGGARLSLSFERAGDAAGRSPGSVYTDAGLAWDYIDIDRVPWDRMRVLRSWNGTP